MSNPENIIRVRRALNAASPIIQREDLLYVIWTSGISSENVVEIYEVVDGLYTHKKITSDRPIDLVKQLDFEVFWNGLSNDHQGEERRAFHQLLSKALNRHRL